MSISIFDKGMVKLYPRSAVIGKKSPKDFAIETELIPAAITTASYLPFPFSALIKIGI
jgi:hypothetical protein